MNEADNTAEKRIELPRPTTPPVKIKGPSGSRVPENIETFKDLSKTRITMPLVLYTGLLIGGNQRQIMSDEIRIHLNADKVINISTNFYRAKNLGLCHSEKAGVNNRNYITLYEDKIYAYFKEHHIKIEDLDTVMQLVIENPEQIAANHTEYARNNSTARKKENKEAEAVEAQLGEQEKQAVDVLSGIIESSNRKDRLLRQIRSLIDAELGDRE